MSLRTWWRSPVKPGLEKIAIYTGVVLTFVSTALAGLAYNQAVKIEGMQVVIDTLSVQSREMKVLTERSLAMVYRLDSILVVMRQQERTQRLNSEPNLQCMGSLQFRSLSDTSVEAAIVFKNEGARTALKVKSTVHLFQNRGDNFQYFGGITTTQNRMDAGDMKILKFPVKAKGYLTNPKGLEEMLFKLVFTYADEGTGKLIIKQFYFHPKFEYDNSITMIEETPELERRLDQLIKNKK